MPSFQFIEKYSSGGTMGSGNFTVFGNAGLDMAEANLVQESIGNNQPGHQIQNQTEHQQIKDAFGSAIAQKARMITNLHAQNPTVEHNVRMVKRLRGG